VFEAVIRDKIDVCDKLAIKNKKRENVKIREMCTLIFI